MDPTVAVIIPCHNSAPYIREAVESVLAQSYRKIEIVVVNDGSTDDFVSAIAAYRDRVRVIDQENQGVSVARNRGIDSCRAPLIAFLDADDRWHPEKVQRQVSLLRQSRCGLLVHTGRRFIDAAGNVIARGEQRPAAQGRCLLELLRQQVRITTSTVLLPRAVLGEERFPSDATWVARSGKGAAAEDLDLWIRLARRFEFSYVDCPLVDYRLHGGNATGNSERMLRSCIAVMERVLRRERKPLFRNTARSELRRHWALLAELHFDRERFREARSAFRKAIPALRLTDWFRLAALYLPRPIFDRVRRRIRDVRRSFVPGHEP